MLHLFRKQSAETIARSELDEAQRGLIEAQRMRDYYTKIAEFHEVRIRSLSKSLGGGA